MALYEVEKVMDIVNFRAPRNLLGSKKESPSMRGYISFGLYSWDPLFFFFFGLDVA